MIKNILITGGAGFIGSNLAIALIHKGYNVTVLDNLSPQIHGENPHSSFLYNQIKNKTNFVRGTVLDKKAWLHALEKQDVVVHLAAETGTGQSMYEIEKYTDVNIKATSILMDILTNTNHTIQKMIIASSRAIYGEGKYHCSVDGDVYPNERLAHHMDAKDFEVKCPICKRNVELVPTDENSKIHPTSIYGITKQVQEQMFLSVGKSLRIPTVAFRYQNVYGAGQSLTNPYTGILSIFSTRIRNGREINIFEDGMESRDFVHVKDVVDATILGLEKREAGYEIYNVGSDERINVLTVAETLKMQYESDVPLNISGNYRLGDIRHNIANINKIKKQLGYKPSVRFEEGIREFVQWVQSQDVAEDLYDKSIKEMSQKGLYK